jgi:hypothetical protein
VPFGAVSVGAPEQRVAPVVTLAFNRSLRRLGPECPGLLDRAVELAGRGDRLGAAQGDHRIGTAGPPGGIDRLRQVGGIGGRIHHGLFRFGGIVGLGPPRDLLDLRNVVCPDESGRSEQRAGQSDEQQSRHSPPLPLSYRSAVSGA